MINIQNKGVRSHTKACETYVDVIFSYDNLVLDTAVPIEYRRTGTFIDEKDIPDYLSKIYDEVNPINWDKWRKEQSEFWKSKIKATITKRFFDVLSSDFSFKCIECDLPHNPNWARRIQDLKEFGYTIATRLSVFCPKCNTKTTHLVLLPIKRGGITGYETWSPTLKKHILEVLKNYDVYEAKVIGNGSLIPDHKFSEIRWDETTRRESLEDISDEEIKRDFQLLSNQRNQQKREVCRNCVQTGRRGILYGIPFFYEGTENWNPNIPVNGKEAEKGCIGCAWYDIEKWRQELIKILAKLD